MSFRETPCRRNWLRRKRCAPIRFQQKWGCRCGCRKQFSKTRVDRELVYNDELAAAKWALNSALE